MTSQNGDPAAPATDAAPISARASYYEAATTWADDTHAALRESRRTAWMVAGGAGVIAVLEAIALLVLMPLKQTVPYTITVDRETGYVQSTRGVALGPLSESEAVAQSFIVQYVLARETFDAQDYQELYRRTLAWSQGTAETDYLRDWDKSNPAGIQSRVNRNTRIQITVKSVTILGPRSAMVRFDAERFEGQGGGMRQPYVASVTYSYSGKPISSQDRYFNPLGFQVSSYRRDAETTQPAALPSPPPPPPAPVTPLPVTPLPGATGPEGGLQNGTVGPQGQAATRVNGLTSPAPDAGGPISTARANPKTGNPNGEEFPNQ